ncbi:hypothetical protein ACFY1U_01925 [Streptomyces sp. NPDC001351]|uniref:hypothetical protein n=1 Tax=Streptomyces sp. NPDC001351 TaxID=3364564 RepID=UPI00367AB932
MNRGETARVAVDAGQGVHMSAVAARAEGEGLAHGLDVFSRRSVPQPDHRVAVDLG